VAEKPETPEEKEKLDGGDHERRVVVIEGGIAFHGNILFAATFAVLAIPLVPFFNSFMSKAGEDAYLALKNFVQTRLERAKKDRLILKDPETLIRVEVTAELPDEAFRQLLQINPAELASPDTTIQAPLRWDSSAGGWVPPS
jgi:hypothetical protein